MYIDRQKLFIVMVVITVVLTAVFAAAVAYDIHSYRDGGQVVTTGSPASAGGSGS